VFINDKFKVTPWLTFIAGLRETAFDASFRRTQPTPSWRCGQNSAPELVFRGFYGYFYQAPPLVTATSALQNLPRSGFCFPLSARRAGYRVQFASPFPIAAGISAPTLRNQSAELAGS